MVEITLYPPNGEIEKYQVENHGVKDGVLRFRSEASIPAMDITTNIPFTVRQTVEAKEESKSARASNPTRGVGGRRRSPWG